MRADRFENAGAASGHYFHQDLLVARCIHSDRPQRHIDVGSSIYGFVCHVASFREIEVLDVRPLQEKIHGITFIQLDVMNLGPDWSEISDSVSCLHALEHFGLGRYGDPIDPDGWEAGLRSLTRLLTVGGRLYLSVPTGKEQRIEFNAHRIFSLPNLRNRLKKDYEVEELHFVLDDGSLVMNVDAESVEAESSFGAEYGCSIWILRKLPTSPAEKK